MTLITPDDGPTGLSASVLSLQKQLSDMKTDLEVLQEKVRAGDLEELKNSTRAISDIRQWLKIAIEAEVTLNERNKRKKGIVRDYALDFDTARAQIGCRLDRLRRARCPNGFPR